MINTNRVLYSSNKEDWETPKNLFEQLNEEFHFELDAAADIKNHKCERYYDKDQNGLIMPWAKRTFCNPPYGKKISKWVEKAFIESLKGNVCVLLLPARTDTNWFHDYVINKAEVRFIRGRIKFNGALYNAPFPSMIVIWR